MKPRLFIIAALIGLVSACNTYSISSNEEPVFENFRPETAAYKNKLAEKIQANPEDLTYVFGRYVNDSLIEVIISGDDFSAFGMVEVNDWTGVEGIRKTKGMSYSGAELSGLQLGIKADPKGAVFVYQSVTSIID